MVAAVVKEKRRVSAASWRRWSALAATLLALIPAPAARAHPEISAPLVNRYLSVLVLGDRLEFFLTLLYGALPGAEERKRMDTDGDGKIGPGELEQARLGWKARARELAAVTVGDQPLDLAAANASVQLGANETVTAAPVVVEIYGSRPLSAGTHQVRLDPGWEPARLGETELGIELTPDWELVSSHQGHGRDEQLRRYRFDGRRPSVVADRSAIFIIRPATTASGSRQRTTNLVAAAVAVLAGVALAIAVRRRSRREPRGA
jgi:hypothetical protein